MTQPTHPAATPSGPQATESGCGCSRRAALRSAGVMAVGAAGLGACGTQDAVSSAASSAVSAATSAAGSAIAAASIPVGGGKIFPDLKVVITQPSDGDFKAFSSICPHQGCPVTSVDGGTINCPCHGSKFDIATGEVTAGPSTQGLAAKGVSIGADGITLT